MAFEKCARCGEMATPWANKPGYKDCVCEDCFKGLDYAIADAIVAMIKAKAHPTLLKEKTFTIRGLL